MIYNPSKLKRAILRVHSNTFKFLTINEIAEIPHDGESVEECGAFVDKLWMDVSVDDWRKHYSAISFFSESARRYFFPSIMFLSVDYHQEISVAIDSYIFHLDRCDSKSDLSEIVGFDQRKMDIFKIWLMYLIGSSKTSSLLKDDLRVIHELLRKRSKKLGFEA